MSRVRRWNWGLDLLEELAPAQMETWECEALIEAVGRVLPKLENQRQVGMKMPGVTKAGKAYLVTLLVGAGVVHGFSVDLDPDLSAPEFEAYTDFRVRADREASDG